MRYYHFLWKIWTSILLEITTTITNLMTLIVTCDAIVFNKMIRIMDFILMLKDMLCFGFRGMILRRMKDLAWADILATVWRKGRLNHGHCECKQCFWKFCHDCCPTVVFVWMWNRRSSSYLLLLIDMIVWKLWTLVHLLVFHLECKIEELFLA